MNNRDGIRVSVNYNLSEARVAALLSARAGQLQAECRVLESCGFTRDELRVGVFCDEMTGDVLDIQVVPVKMLRG